MNAFILLKNDFLLRLDAMVEVSAKSLHDVLLNNDRYDKWFINVDWTCLSNTLLKGQDSVFCLTFATSKGTKYDFLYRRFVKSS